MAVGDIINVLLNNADTYQPAATIEIIVLKSFNSSDVGSIGVTNGVLSGYTYVSRSDANSTSQLGNKIGITNTNYYWNGVNTIYNGFSGIQIK